MVFQQKPASTRELREHLAARLPSYQIPDVFVQLDSLPMTPIGKLDRKALPSPTFSRALSQERFVEPATPVERMLADLWKDVLRVERVGAHDDFFELGGPSLLATQLASRIRAAFRIEIPLSALMGARTVVETALLVQAYESAEGQAAKVAQAWQRLKNMSEDERATLAAQARSQAQPAANAESRDE